MDMERVMEILLVFEEKMNSLRKTDRQPGTDDCQDGCLAGRNEGQSKRVDGLPRSDGGLSRKDGDKSRRNEVRVGA
jgi:hypothetical protein